MQLSIPAASSSGTRCACRSTSRRSAWLRPGQPEPIPTERKEHNVETGRDLIVVTGATGKQGGATARELLAKGHRVRAMTRKPDSPAAWEIAKLGAEVVA